jgi:alpha-D-xyloside xylohydrolase
MGLGPSGFPFFASDTGGYRAAPPDRETLVRWFQHTALSAAMQVGNSASGQPWELLEGDDLALYAAFARLHLRLFPYLWTYADALDGGGQVASRPIVRPFGLVEPALGQHPDSVYFLGDHLLVAPVVDAGAATKRLPVPSGAWVSWWDGSPLDGSPGQEVEVAAPLDTLPLYLRAGGIVPLLRPTIDTLSPVEDTALVDSFASDAGVLWARVAVGDGAFSVYDGSTLAVADDGALTLTWTAGAVFTQGAAWEVVGLGARPASVTVDGRALSEGEDWSWDGAVLTVERAGAEVVVVR